MALKHADIWRAIGELAKRNGLSLSGLAKKAGLSATAFNPSKRQAANRKRWPSTESIAQILQATHTPLEDFVMLASSDAAVLTSLPLLGYAEAGREGYFDESGHPTGSGWEKIRFAGLADANAFALEISGNSMEPVYREGDRIVVSPAEKVRRGDRVALRTKKGEVMVKQLAKETLQKFDLVSLNTEHTPISINTRDIEWIHRIIWVSQ